jgi:hypothetical protein
MLNITQRLGLLNAGIINEAVSSCCSIRNTHSHKNTFITFAFTNSEYTFQIHASFKIRIKNECSSLCNWHIQPEISRNYYHSTNSLLSLQCGQREWEDVKLITRFQLISRLRMSGAISLLPLYAFIAWIRTPSFRTRRHTTVWHFSISQRCRRRFKSSGILHHVDW